MDIKPQIYRAKVSHHRLFPKKNSFTYSLYYLALPLPAPKVQSSFLKFEPKDLGYRDGSDPEFFARKILASYGFCEKIKDIMLITMPRVFGYIFNPVSFYFCLDKSQSILAVIAEVHNTFGEQHAYFCAKPNHSPIQNNEWLQAEKSFHVSPFLERNGHYKFKFSADDQKLSIWIDYFDKEMNKQLITSLLGTLEPLNSSSLRKAFWDHPLVTLKTITLIHWQALKLFFKKVGYIKKPPQNEIKVTSTITVEKSKTDLIS